MYHVSDTSNILN